MKSADGTGLIPQPSATRLGDLVQIIPGYSDRQKPQPHPSLLRIVGARAVRDECVAWDQLEPCERRPGAERAQLRDGDLLLAVRSVEPRVVRISRPPAGTVAGASFAILRDPASTVDLGYLHWHLNAAGPRDRLRSMLRGSSIAFLPIADLASLEVSLPPLTRQLAIVRVATLRARLSALTHRLDHSIDRLLEHAAITPDSA